MSSFPEIVSTDHFLYYARAFWLNLISFVLILIILHLFIDLEHVYTTVLCASEDKLQ